MILPCSITAILLATRLTASISWVIRTTVSPIFWLRLFKRSRIWLVFCGSKAEVASSEIRIFGSLARARAMETRCCSPPESWTG